MTDTEGPQIRARIDELTTFVGEIAGDVKVIAGTCERFGLVLDGNGTPGLASRVATMEGSRKESSRWTTLVSHGTVAIVVGLVVAFFGR